MGAAGGRPVRPESAAGRNGLRTFAAKVGGLVPEKADDPEAGFDPERVMSSKERRKMDRFIVFALAAADESDRSGRMASVE